MKSKKKSKSKNFTVHTKVGVSVDPVATPAEPPIQPELTSEPKPKPAQNAEMLHFFNSEYTMISRVMGEAFKTVAMCIEQLPDSFSKAVALRHLLESRDWTARAQYMRPVEQWVIGQPNAEFKIAK